VSAGGRRNPFASGASLHFKTDNQLYFLCFRGGSGRYMDGIIEAFHPRCHVIIPLGMMRMADPPPPPLPRARSVPTATRAQQQYRSNRPFLQQLIALVIAIFVQCQNQLITERMCLPARLAECSRGSSGKAQETKVPKQIRRYHQATCGICFKSPLPLSSGCCALRRHAS